MQRSTDWIQELERLRLSIDEARHQCCRNTDEISFDVQWLPSTLLGECVPGPELRWRSKPLPLSDCCIVVSLRRRSKELPQLSGSKCKDLLNIAAYRLHQFRRSRLIAERRNRYLSLRISLRNAS